MKSRAVDLKDILSVVEKRKWVILVPFLIVVAIAFGGSYLLTKEYESSAIVGYHNDPNLIKPLSGLVPTDDEGRMTSEDRHRLLAAFQNEVISSRTLSRLILDLKLDDDPEIRDKAKSS